MRSTFDNPHGWNDPADRHFCSVGSIVAAIATVIETVGVSADVAAALGLVRPGHLPANWEVAR